MPDLLVKLFKLPRLTEPNDHSINIRRAQPFELTKVRSFVESNFSISWADELSVGFAHHPVTVFITTWRGKVVGFAAYECTRKAFFGPTGVDTEFQKRGIGTALLLNCLWGLRELGYV